MTETIEQDNIPGSIMKFIANYIKDAKTTQHIETTHAYVNVKLAFLKMVSSDPDYLTYTLQTYHHLEHRFRSCRTQMTSPSHPHTQARVRPRNTYNHTYIRFMPGRLCPLCKTEPHTTHLFNCTKIIHNSRSRLCGQNTQ